jgi:hypothetical protein
MKLAVPVFQFGVFYEEDLEIFPGPEMVFGGPVHTNEDGYIGCNESAKFDDKVTVCGNIYGDRKDDPGLVPGGNVKIKDGSGNYVSMKKDGEVIDHNHDLWDVLSTSRWDGRFIDSSHRVSEMKMSIGVDNNNHEILERKDPHNDGPGLQENKFEYKADITLWADSEGQLYGLKANGDDFDIVSRDPATVNGRLKIDERDGAGVEFLLQTADGRTISGSELEEFTGQATSVRLYTRGDQDHFSVDGQEHYIADNSVVELQADGSMDVEVYQDDDDGWFVRWNESQSADLNVDGVPTGGSERPPVATLSSFGDFREGNGSAKTMRSIDIDVESLGSHPDYPPQGAVVYVYNESAGEGETGVVRLKNGESLPPNGLTVATPDPAYIQGDYNNSGFVQPSLVAADAVNILSNNWDDANSWEYDTNQRKASYTEVNTVLMTGNTDTHEGQYNGGLENVLRFLEKWSGVELKYRGSIVCMWNSETATGRWVYGNGRYQAPRRNWGYDEMYRDPRNSPPGIPLVITLEALTWRQARWTEEETTVAEGELGEDIVAN